MASKSLTIMITFNFSCFLLGLILYIIPILKNMDDITNMSGIQLCAGRLIIFGKYIYFTYLILSGSINFKTALENVKTRKLFMLHSVFLFLMICWTFGSWCRVQIFKRQNSVNLWKYRYRLYHSEYIYEYFLFYQT